MADQGKSYLSYLLRLWLVQNHEGYVWRCSLENVQTGERHGFAGPESMCEFLREGISSFEIAEESDDRVEE